MEFAQCVSSPNVKKSAQHIRTSPSVDFLSGQHCEKKRMPSVLCVPQREVKEFDSQGALRAAAAPSDAFFASAACARARAILAGRSSLARATSARPGGQHGHVSCPAVVVHTKTSRTNGGFLSRRVSSTEVRKTADAHPLKSALSLNPARARRPRPEALIEKISRPGIQNLII